MRYALILAGGVGTRLWPLSRTFSPKHLLPLDGEESLLRQTIRRLPGEIPAGHIWTLTQKDQFFQVRDQLISLDTKLGENILVEPEGRNTLPPIAWGVETVLSQEEDPLIGVFPADHTIRNGKKFLEILEEGWRAAGEGFIVTLGIPPTAPETGFGYIEAGDRRNKGEGYRIRSFREKPDRKTAENYLQKGNYYWNAGIFLFQAKTFRKEMERLQPKILSEISHFVGRKTEMLRDEALTRRYRELPSLSIDYGLMEKISNGVVIPADIGWSDLGSWESVYHVGSRTAEGNVIRGKVKTVDTEDSLLLAEEGTIAAIGLKGVVVVKTGDATLVASRDKVQWVKEIVDRLKGEKSELVSSHRSVQRPWGSYTVLEEGTGHKVKRIVVKPGEQLSLQLHRYRAEHWVVIRGKAKIVRGEEELTLNETESTFILVGCRHRIANPGPGLLEIIEVQTGSSVDEEDIVRLKDIYGRI